LDLELGGAWVGNWVGNSSKGWEKGLGLRWFEGIGEGKNYLGGIYWGFLDF